MACALPHVPLATAALAEEAAPAADPQFAQPYVDVDEWRDGPVRHRYVHGGFRGTETRFSYYLPPKEQYQGRFFQHITPVPDNENLAQKAPAGPLNKMMSALAEGAYYVETNGGGAIDMTKGSNFLADPTITAYRANAAAAQYSRTVATAMYGGKRPFGYAYGGSGGGFRTIGSIENTRGVWDGVVPYVIGSTMAIPNMFTVRMQALRVLRGKLPQIADALEPGGSGNAYAGLTGHEAAVLRELERMGFPMSSWFGHESMGLHGFAALYGGVALADPAYFADFWSKPGYLGHDQPELFAADRMQFDTVIASPVTAADAVGLGIETNPFAQQSRGDVDAAYKVQLTGDPARIVGFRLARTPPASYFLGGELVIVSGAAKGKRLMLATLVDDVAMLGYADKAAIEALKAGDAVRVDNSNFLAMETYHRHQVPGPDFPVWDQFRGRDGKPLYPQRPRIIGPMFVKTTSGSEMTGKFDGKMIVVASLWDREAMPWQADWYRQRVEASGGDRIRLWYTEHALHGDDPSVGRAARVVSYVPVLQQALADVANWAENGVAPPESTAYRIADGQVLVPPGAAARGGVQPVVHLSAGGMNRVVMRAGQAIRITGTIAAPRGAGTVVAADWDVQGAGTFDVAAEIPAGRSQVRVSLNHRFDKPGTYFVGLRGALQRQGSEQVPYRRIQNIARVRVVVR